MVGELAKAVTELPPAAISAVVLTNNGHDDDDLSDTGKDLDNSVHIYTNTEKVQSPDVPSSKVLGGIEDTEALFVLHIGLILA